MTFRLHGKECSGCEDVGGEQAASNVVAPMANVSLEADQEEVEGEEEVEKVVLVQTKSKYKWPGLVVGSDGTQLTVQLFDKHGLKGQQRSFEASAVEVFQWSNELDDLVENTGNHELRNAYNKALKIVHGLD